MKLQRGIIKNKEIYICGMCLELETEEPMHSLDNKVWLAHKIVIENYKYGRYGLCFDHKERAVEELYKILKANDKTRIKSKMYLAGNQWS